MFNRRQKLAPPTWEQRVAEVRPFGITAQPPQQGRQVFVRAPYAAIVDVAAPQLVKAGVVVQGEVGMLTDVGYQKWWVTHSGHRQAALAEELKGLHSLVEDLREALGLTSLYNESLGTTNTNHLYDRVEDRDHPHGPRPWEE
jgi:hypothetical protein